MSLANLRHHCVATILLGASLLCLLFAGHTGAAVTYWDPQGTTGANPFLGSMSGTWETNSWSTASGGSATPVAWIEQTAAVFGVHSGKNTPAYTVTMNADHQIAGAFDGSLAPNSSDVTITGTGHWQLANAQGFNLNNASDGSLAMLRINVPIVDGSYASATTGQLIAQGNGQLFLNATNTYSGGNFTLGIGGTLLGYASANFTGIVNFNNNSSFGTGAIVAMRGISSSFGAMVAENAGINIPNTLDFSQAVLNTTTTNPTPFLNIVGSSVASGGTTFSGPVLLGNKAVNLGSGGTGNLLILSGVVSGTGGSLTKFNASTLALSGVNTYTGGTTIGNGTLSVSNVGLTGANSNLGTNGTINFGATTTAGVLLYTGAGETSDKVINLAGTTGGGTIDQSGTGLLKFTSDLTATGVGSKTLTLQGSTAGTGEIAGKIVDNSSTNKTSVTKSGTGTWTLSGANPYSGNTRSGAGTLVVANSSALQNSTLDMNSADSGALTFSTGLGTANIGGLTGSRNLSTNDASSGAVALNIGNNNSNTTYSGQLTGAGSLTKQGTGKLILSGGNIYTGGTTVSAGTLLANNTTGSATGSGAVTVNGGTFGGTGAVSGPVTVNNTGTLSPGASVAALATGALTFNTGSNLLYEIDSSAALSAGADLLNSSGALAIAPGVTLTLNDVATTPGSVPVGSKFTMISYSGPWDGDTFNSVPDNSVLQVGGNYFYVNYDDTTGGTNFGGGTNNTFVTLTAVPEANAFWLGGAICLVLGLTIGTRKLIGYRSAA